MGNKTWRVRSTDNRIRLAIARATMKMRVLNAIRDCGRRGATCEELEDLLVMRHQTVSARLVDLQRDEVVVSKKMRLTSSGRPAKVWHSITKKELQAKGYIC